MDPNYELSATRIPEEEKTGRELKKRELREMYLPLIYELSDMQINVAAAEVSDKIRVIRGLKMAILKHIKNCKDFASYVDKLRLEMIDEQKNINHKNAEIKNF